MRRPPLTNEQKERIAEFREQKGLSCAAIARLGDCSGGSVSWYCLTAGIMKPGAKLPPQRKPIVAMRGGKPVRMFTAEEDARIESLDQQGVAHAAIARELQRKPNSIRGRLATLARRQELEAAE